MTATIAGDFIIGTIDIAAPPDAVFDALVDPHQLELWWGSDHTYRTSNWKVEHRVGGAWSCDARNASGALTRVAGTILETERPRVLAYSWNPSWEQIPETTIRYTIEPAGNGARLRVVHSGFAGHHAAQHSHSDGWSMVLEWLREFFNRETV